MGAVQADEQTGNAMAQANGETGPDWSLPGSSVRRPPSARTSARGT